MPKSTLKDPTSAKRTAAIKQRIIEDGGSRRNINLWGGHIRKLDYLVSIGYADNHTGVIHRLIEEAKI